MSRMSAQIPLGPVTIVFGFAAAVGATLFLAWSSVDLMISDWMIREEYSHGMLIPLLSAYLIYQRRGILAGPPVHSWMGLLGVVVGLMVILFGKVSTIHALSQYGLVLTLIGFFYALFGIRSWKHTLVPLCLLFFMVPLPHFLHQAASAELQLLSSQLGVFIVRLFGISVFLEGNVIDLGSYKLQVLEACDGLRYLFPLMTLSFIFAYLYKGPLWARSLLFLSAIPITVLMNSIRIGTIGVMVEYWGTAMAEGFLHDFQGWSIFLVSVVVLLLITKLLALIAGDRRPLQVLLVPETIRSADGLDGTSDEARSSQAWRGSLIACCAALLFSVGAVTAASAIANKEPTYDLSRADFLRFPMQLTGGWEGRRRTLESHFLDELKLDDYLLADYHRAPSQWANLYVAYYDDQASGRSVHSPRTCLPGGGWEMQEFETILIDDGRGARHPVNRVIIGKGLNKQLVYYWFEQRGRTLASEYAVKWYLFRDSLFEGRTDGALVRLIAPFEGGEKAREETEAALSDMYRAVRVQMPAFVPG